MPNIIWQRPDGGISVTVLVDGASPEAEATKLKERSDVPVDWQAVAYDQVVPDDRTFRGAWAWVAGAVRHGMVPARAICREWLRRHRVPLFAILDAAYMKAHEAGNTTLMQQIAAKRQFLRDITVDPRIDSAETVADLKAALETMKTEMTQNSQAA